MIAIRKRQLEFYGISKARGIKIWTNGCHFLHTIGRWIAEKMPHERGFIKNKLLMNATKKIRKTERRHFLAQMNKSQSENESGNY